MTPTLLARRNIAFRRWDAAKVAQFRYYLRKWLCAAPVEDGWTEEASSLKIVELTPSDICAAEFADWSLLDTDIGNDDFLGECMRLYSAWCAVEAGDEDEEDEDEDSLSSDGCDSECGCRQYFYSEEISSDEDQEDLLSDGCSGPITPYIDVDNVEWPCPCGCEERLAKYEADVESGMQLFALWTADDGEEEEAVPETDDIEYGCANYFHSKDIHSWDLEEEAAPETDGTECSCANYFHPFYSSISTIFADGEEDVPEPDAHDSLLMAALISTMEPMPSPSDGPRALSCPDVLMKEKSAAEVVPQPKVYRILLDSDSDWDCGTDSSEDSAINATTYPVDTYQVECCPRCCLLTVDPDNCCSSTLSTSSLFKDPSSDPSSDPSLFSIDPTGVASSPAVTSSIDVDPSTDLSDLSDPSSTTTSYCAPCCVPAPFCPHGTRIDSCDYELASSSSSSVTSGYETDTDDEPVVKKIDATTQTEEANDKVEVTRMLAECESMIEKLMETRKKLREMM